MVDLTTVLQILSLIPPLQFGTPNAPIAQPEGQGTLLITGCQPGEGVAVFPGPFAAIAGQDGTVRIPVPAQRSDAPSYQVMTAAGDSPIHGTLGTGEFLSGSCP